MIEPEQYDEFGEIVEKSEVNRPYGRTLSTYDQHRIHETKDIFDGDCEPCLKAARKYWTERQREWEGNTDPSL